MVPGCSANIGKGQSRRKASDIEATVLTSPAGDLGTDQVGGPGGPGAADEDPEVQHDPTL
jgi:hypothetical protein